MTDYVTHYPGLCSACNDAIRNCAFAIRSGLADEEYVNDREGPNMMAYDLGMLHFDACPDGLMKEQEDRKDEIAKLLKDL